MPVEVDDLGREHRAMGGGRVQEPLLIDPDPNGRRRDVPGRRRRVGVVRDRCVGGVPADAELDRRRSDREALDVHHRRQPRPGSLGQRRPWRDRLDLFGPRRDRTRARRTATGGGRTPAPSAPRRSADRAPWSGCGRDRPRAPTVGHHADRRGSRRSATTRHREHLGTTTSSGIPTSAVTSSLP